MAEEENPIVVSEEGEDRSVYIHRWGTAAKYTFKPGFVGLIVTGALALTFLIGFIICSGLRSENAAKSFLSLMNICINLALSLFGPAMVFGLVARKILRSNKLLDPKWKDHPDNPREF